MLPVDVEVPVAGSNRLITGMGRCAGSEDDHLIAALAVAGGFVGSNGGA